MGCSGENHSELPFAGLLLCAKGGHLFMFVKSREQELKDKSPARLCITTAAHFDSPNNCPNAYLVREQASCGSCQK